MIKSWLITTSAPFCGTDEYYTAFSEEDPTDIQEVNDWFWEETENIWDKYGYLSESELDEAFENDGGDDFESYSESWINDWRNECTITASEMSIEKLKEYTVTGTVIPEIIYDERE